MIFLRLREVFEGEKLYHDFLLVVFLLFVQDLSGDIPVGILGIIDSASVLAPHIISLLIETCGIHHPEIIVEKLFQTDFIRIIADLHRLGMTALL